MDSKMVIALPFMAGRKTRFYSSKYRGKKKSDNAFLKRHVIVFEAFQRTHPFSKRDNYSLPPNNIII